MRTLALLASILLLVFLAQANPLGETADEALAQDEDGAEEQDVAVSFDEDKRSAPDASDSLRKKTCYCRRGFCKLWERRSGMCRIGSLPHNLCCNWF